MRRTKLLLGIALTLVIVVHVAYYFDAPTILNGVTLSIGLTDTTGIRGTEKENAPIVRKDDARHVAKCPIKMSSGVKDVLFDTPPLPDELRWKNMDPLELHSIGRNVLYYKSTNGFSTSSPINRSAGWNTTYVYPDPKNTSGTPTLDEYIKELRAREWKFAVNVHGYEIHGIQADGASGSIVAYVKHIDDLLRVVAIKEHWSYLLDPEKDFPENVVGIENHRTRFLSLIFFRCTTYCRTIDPDRIWASGIVS